MPHIVDILIEERARGLMQRPLVWWFVKTLLYPALGHQATIDTIDAVQELSAPEIFRYFNDTLNMAVDCKGLRHVPRSGSAVIVANHPAGIADGIAIYDVLKRIREDITFFANRDAIRVAPQLAELVIPVEWVEEKRTRHRNKETVKYLVRAFRDKRLIVIFPSGRLARPSIRGLVERAWTPTALNLAQKYRCPVVPMHIQGSNSWLYYLLYFLNTELKDMTLFRELLNKKNQHYALTLAAPFHPVGDSRALTLALREFVTMDLPRGADRFILPDTGTSDPAPHAHNH